jgi:hypothetical protein
LSTFKTTRYWIFIMEKIRKDKMLLFTTDTTESTKNGRLSILMKRMMNQLLDLMKTVDSTETDHSI